MNKIKIYRKRAFTGWGCKMICYIDDIEICRLKENESYVYETKNKKCEFKCQLTLGNPMSEKYLIDFSKGGLVNIDSAQGSWKPKVNISYMSEVSSNVQKEIKSIEQVNNFNATKMIGNYLYIDEEKKQWAIPKGLASKIKKVYDYTEILSFELIEDGNSVSKGGIGRALVGGALFGDVGAIVGGVTGHKNKKTCTKLQIKITINNSNNPVEYITLISSETKKSSLLYTTSYSIAQEIISILEIMCNSNVENGKSSQQISGADEILKYKKLLDEGIITQEEFEKKKKQILDL